MSLTRRASPPSFSCQPSGTVSASRKTPLPCCSAAGAAGAPLDRFFGRGSDSAMTGRRGGRRRTGQSPGLIGRGDQEEGRGALPSWSSGSSVTLRLIRRIVYWAGGRALSIIIVSTFALQVGKEVGGRGGRGQRAGVVRSQQRRWATFASEVPTGRAGLDDSKLASTTDLTTSQQRQSTCPQPDGPALHLARFESVRRRTLELLASLEAALSRAEKADLTRRLHSAPPALEAFPIVVQDPDSSERSS